jgi:hypothetical protein
MGCAAWHSDAGATQSLAAGKSPRETVFFELSLASILGQKIRLKSAGREAEPEASPLPPRDGQVELAVAGGQ